MRESDATLIRTFECGHVAWVLLYFLDIDVHCYASCASHVLYGFECIDYLKLHEPLMAPC